MMTITIFWQQKKAEAYLMKCKQMQNKKISPKIAQVGIKGAKRHKRDPQKPYTDSDDSAEFLKKYE